MYLEFLHSADTLASIGNRVYHISNVRTVAPPLGLPYIHTWKEKQLVFVRIDVGGHITISLGRPLLGSGVGFALDSHSATKVDRRTLFYEDGWPRLSLFPASGERKGLKASSFAKEGRRGSPPQWEEAARFNPRHLRLIISIGDG